MALADPFPTDCFIPVPFVYGIAICLFSYTIHPDPVKCNGCLR